MTEAQRYRVIERIAAGGMAEVYRGESAGIEGFRKKVAIKRVLPKLSANQEFIDMFLDEARLCAYLNHSKCVQVFDIGQGGGAHFIVMEYVDGADLKGILDHLHAQGRTMKASVACLIAQQICEGLAYAHDAVDHTGQPLQIVHRDVSPHNVLMTRYGEVKLVDFGLARASSHLTDEDEDIVKGKFGYLAPEITRGKPADRRVDIFAAGILLWEMLAGRRLFHGETDLETFKLVQAAIIPQIREFRSDVTLELAQVLARALAADPAQRYQTAHDFARDLAVVLVRQGEPVTYQDLASLVAETATARARAQHEKANVREPGDMLGDVIIDALHEFSGLASEPPTRGKETAGSDTAPSGFVDPSEWGLDDALGDFLAAAAPASVRSGHRDPVPVRAPRPKPPPPPTRRAPPTRRPTPEAIHRSTHPPDSKGAPWWKKWWG